MNKAPSNGLALVPEFKIWYLTKNYSLYINKQVALNYIYACAPSLIFIQSVGQTTSERNENQITIHLFCAIIWTVRIKAYLCSGLSTLSTRSNVYLVSFCRFFSCRFLCTLASHFFISHSQSQHNNYQTYHSVAF